MLQKGIFLSLVLVAGTVAAQEEAADGPWSGNASLGFLSTSGNTDTTSYNTKLRVGYSPNDWTHTFTASANGAIESEVTTAEAYQAGWKSEYNFTETDFVFGRINWRKDRFSGVEEQRTESVGYGRRLIDTPSHILNAEIGAGHRAATLADGTKEEGFIGRAGIDYNWIFSETSGFEQTVDVESGADNTYIESVSALRARVLGDFAVVLSYTIKHNTDVPVGSQNTDRLSAVSIEYSF